ncbi:MAG: hypothetical protein CBC78_003345 [Candidatus Pelagibacter sp. TMED118]|nr:MAG: hypothetical protein CBC78_003345 [Candidatus Pelagibacter sp. TMED118]
MKIFDCFMYFDEEVTLDVRLNTLDKFVDYFVIVEASFTHRGDHRKLLFNHNKFSKFKDKIIYLDLNEQPSNIEQIYDKDDQNTKTRKYIMNALYRENSQRNYIIKGLINADKEDFIMVSDVDEIPKIENINFSKIDEKIILFKQDMFYYKFNLAIPKFKWTGTKACKFKNLINPQWLRNIKDRKYPFYRIDTLFSKTKYTSIKVVDDGGWHFSNIKNAESIEHKLRSYLHHREFDMESLSSNQIEDIIKEKRAIYNLNVDKTVNKVGSGNKLESFDKKKLPIYIQKNENLFSEWID